MIKIFSYFSREEWRRRVVKAVFKSLIVIGAYFFVMFFLQTMFDLVPSLLSSFQVIVVLFVVFVVVGEFASKTIFQPVISGVRASLVFVYMIYGSSSEVVSLTVDNVSLTMDLGVFFYAGAILSLMSIVVSALELLFFLNKRTESQAGLLQVDGRA